MHTSRLYAEALFAVALFAGIRWAVQRRALARPVHGTRGMARADGMSGSFLFRCCESLVRWLARGVARCPLDALRARIETRLLQGGQPLGLCADEVIAASLLLSALLGVGLAYVAAAWNAPWLGFVIGVLVGGLGLYDELGRHVRRRLRQIERALPPTVDLLALAMSAGLDLLSALEAVIGTHREKADALQTELLHVVRALRLGQTRRDALVTLRERAPSHAVRDFVAAVIQADAKGTPLATVLETQARTLRVRRSMLAEEAAARAGVLLLLPLMLLLVCIMLLLFGPLVIRGISGD